MGPEFFDEALVLEMFYNKNLEIGSINATYICKTFIDNIVANFRLTLTQCDCVNK
jgi:hypothetical protein